MEKNMEKNCPCCDRHCPTDQLHCNRGREHFGLPLEEERGGRGHGEHGHGEHGHGGHGERGHGEHGRGGHGRPEEDGLITLLRRCGHYLHHGTGEADLSALTREERAELERLLQKCLDSWQQ